MAESRVKGGLRANRSRLTALAGSGAIAGSRRRETIRELRVLIATGLVKLLLGEAPRSSEIGAREDGVAEVSPLEVGLLELGVDEESPIEAGIAEIGPLEVGTAEVGL